MNKRKSFTSYCCNPLKKEGHYHIKKSLRRVSEWMVTVGELPSDAKICAECRWALQKIRLEKQQAEIPQSSSMKAPLPEPEICIASDESTEDPSFESTSISIEALNLSLASLGESPVKKKRLTVKKYATTKVKQINHVLKSGIFRFANATENELMEHFKKMFNGFETRNQKLTFLTTLPPTWTRRKIMEEFNVSSYTVSQSRQLLAKKGPLSTPDQRPGRSLPSESIALVKAFYNSDEVGRLMPGKKDCVKFRDETGAKFCVQKRLMLINLREMYELFKTENENIKIGFSKFAELRPKNCILAGPKGTHSVCVCLIHQNVKLMIENSSLASLTNGIIKNYKDCLQIIMCETPNENCHMGKCKQCPGISKVETILEEAFEEHFVEHVTFRKWVTVDRCNLELTTLSAQAFIELFSEKLLDLRVHHFIAQQQSSFLKNKKNSLQDGEVIALGDFAENYTFVIQDEAQSYHWAATQSTIHPFLAYYKDNETQELKYLSFVIISESLEHDTVAVHVFQKRLIEFLKAQLKTIKKVVYFSDGCAAQYKNRKNFINLTYHEGDFQVPAEWHFFATSHGKGPCDGLGGTVKRLAAKASLQRPYADQILTPRALYDWAREAIERIHFEYVTKEDHIEEEDFLRERFLKALLITGTRKFHSYIPSSNEGKLLVKFYSSSQDAEERTIERKTSTLTFSEMSGYVVVVYEEEWWIGYVLEKNEEEGIVFISFLHPHGPSSSFKYPTPADRLWIASCDILCKVNPTTPTGRVYNLPADDVTKAVKAFDDYRAEL